MLCVHVLCVADAVVVVVGPDYEQIHVSCVCSDGGERMQRQSVPRICECRVFFV